MSNLNTSYKIFIPKTTSKPPTEVYFFQQAERYVDRKLDQAEGVLKKGQKKAKKWYSSLIGDETGAKINNLHIFLLGFTGGVAIGLASGR